MKRLSLAVFALLLGGCGDDGTNPPMPFPIFDGGPAVEPARDTPPTVPPASPFQPPAVDRFTLGNGVQVTLVERHVVPAVTWVFQMAGGALSDVGAIAGRAELCNWVALNQPNDDYQVLADMGSRAYEQTLVDATRFSGFSLSKYLVPTIKIWAEGLITPSVDLRTAASLADQLSARATQSHASPGFIANHLYSLSIYGANHPYNALASAGSYAAAAAQGCSQYTGAFIRPGDGRLYIGGDITHDQVVQNFDSLLGGPIPSPLAPAPPPVPQPTRILFFDVPGATQSLIRVWGPGPLAKAPDDAATVMAAIFAGDSTTSRLGVDLREMMGSTYGVGGGFTYTKIEGHLWIYASIVSDKTAAAIAAILTDAQAMQTADVTDDELARWRDGPVNALPTRFATVSQTLGELMNLDNLEMPSTYFQDLPARYAAIDKAAVKQAAVHYLDPTQLHFVVVGDRQAVLPGLTALTTAPGPLMGAPVTIVDANGTPLAP